MLLMFKFINLLCPKWGFNYFVSNYQQNFYFMFKAKSFLEIMEVNIDPKDYENNHELLNPKSLNLRAGSSLSKLAAEEIRAFFVHDGSIENETTFTNVCIFYFSV